MQRWHHDCNSLWLWTNNVQIPGAKLASSGRDPPIAAREYLRQCARHAGAPGGTLDPGAQEEQRWTAKADPTAQAARELP